MAYPVYQLDCDPQPGEWQGGRPMLANWPEETPEAKGDERDVEDEESALEVRRDQAAHEVGGRKDIVESAHVLLDGVGGLSADKGKKRQLETRHKPRQPPNESRISCTTASCAG